MNLKVYIASPYTIGDTAINVKKQLDCFTLLSDMGYYPYAPLLTHFIHMANPRPYDTWMNHDFVWIKECDALLRLRGESSGADAEVDIADRYDIPVFRDIEELYLWAKRTGWNYDKQITLDWCVNEYRKINQLQI